MNKNITKVSVFLRKVGNSSQVISINENGSGFDATNFSNLQQGNPNAVFDNFVYDYYGPGYIKIENKKGLGSTDWPTLTYPIVAEKYGKYKLFIRVRADSTSNFNFSVSINGKTESEHEITIGLSWSWIFVYVVIPDNKPFELSLTPKTENVYLDSFYITKNGLPSDFSYTSSYVTLHMKMFEIDSQLKPSFSMPIYNYKTTIEEIVDDNWYNFETKALPGSLDSSFDKNYAIALYSSGVSDNLYLMWDYSKNDDPILDPYTSLCALTLDPSTRKWDIDYNKKYAIKIFSFRDSLDENACKIIVPASALALSATHKFDLDSLEPVFVQTKVVEIDNEKNKVSLNLPDRQVSIIMDQSGSMSWNDSQGLRHEITQRMVDRLEATYPGEVKYNLLSLCSTPIKINFFAVVESDQVNTSDSSAVASSFFADQESGYAGVRIIRKKGAYPTGPLDGEIVTEGFIERAYNESLIENEKYFYAAYTFNSSGVFSDGRFLQVVPRTKTVPRGVGGFTYRVITGTGVKRDENLIGAWHLNEAVGNYSYDFSNNPIILSSTEDVLWLNNYDVPSGVSGVRFNGSNSRLVGYDESKFIQVKYTFMAWIYPYNFSEKRIIFSRETPDQDKMTFKLGTNTNGTLFFSMDDLTTVSSSSIIPENEWTHVAVTVDTDTKIVNFYINGSSAGSGFVTQLGYYSQEPMNLYIGGKSSSFFGKITELSVHNVIRSENYISTMSTIPTDPKDKITDNGDRLIVLKYTVPEDYNYSGGKIKILKKEAKGVANFSYYTPPGSTDSNLVFDGFGEKPSSEIDGEIVYNEIATVGEHVVSLPYNYIHERHYYFRIYSQNVLGNYSLSSDSPILDVNIPGFLTTDIKSAAISTPFIPQIKNVQIKPGNHKNYISWEAVNDDITEQVFVYWSDKGFPVINNEAGVDSSAILVFNGDPSETSFVDRNIENEIVNYYAIVAADRYGNFSSPYYTSSVSLDNADESGIPLLDVKQFRYEIVNENAVSLAWDAPVKFQKNIQGWFDQRIALFAQITDEFGAPIADASKITFSANANVTSAQLAEDVFSEIIDRDTNIPDPNKCFSLSSSSIGNGYIRGVFKMTSDLDILSSISLLDADITVSYVVPDRENPDNNVFEFTSLPIHIQMQNPFAMEIVNIGDNSSNFGTLATSTGVQNKLKRRTSSENVLVDPVPIQESGGDVVKYLCKQTVPLDDPSFISSGGLLFDPNKFKNFDGCWIRRKKPFVARVIATYRGQSIPVGSNCNVAVFEASDPECDPDEDTVSVSLCADTDSPIPKKKPFVPDFSDRRSRSVQPPATSIPLKTGLQKLSDGTTKQVSYVDVPLSPPNSPQAVMLFGKVGYNGFYARKKMYIVFDNILRIETTIEPPEANCIDVAEQQARIYLIDPDSPNIENPRKIPITDHQIVRWDIKKGRSGKDRPFYSTDNVPSGPGVFSYTRSGSARRIFFGPACGVTWEIYAPCPGNIVYLPELYAIKASVSYDGLTAFEERPAIIYPINFAGNTFGSRFLMTMPQYVNNLYADGYDFVGVTIYHDPNITGGETASCFRQCAEDADRPVFVLNNGQIIEIESGADFEILYGQDITFTYDEALEEYIITKANQEVGFTQIPLAQKGNSTSFYLRVNKFIGRPKTETSDNQSENEERSNPCPCISVPPGLAKKKGLFTVSGSTSINFDGETRYLRGGGDLKSGVPPTTIDLKEPLDISIVDIRRNGISSQKILCDGVSIHEFIVEVKFKQKPVPNGTPVFLSIAGKNPEKIILQSDTIYTSKVNDSILNKDGPQRSFASFFVAPFGPETAFEAQIKAETNYDKRGDVIRSMTACVTIKYDPSQPKEEIVVVDKPEGEINNVFSSTLEVYDTFTDTWNKKASMKHARGCLTLNWIFDPYGEQLYAMGGLDGKSILAYNERYDIETDSWSTKKPMITPRFYHMSAQDGNYIYVFGGIVASGSDLVVSSSVERYNTESDVWESVGSMPVFDQNTYGVALGSCVVVYGKAYIIGGVRKIGSKGAIDAFNDRILVFDFDTLTWSWSEPFVGGDLVLYERISPFAFGSADASSIHVSGGAITGEKNTETGITYLEFITDSFKINLLDLTIDIDDFIYKQIPSPRYRGIATSIIDKHYFLGGTSSKSQVLNILELVQEDSPIYSYESLSKMPIAKTSFGGVSDNWRNIYVAGGLTSGRPAGFLQIKAKVNPSLIRLDGKQSATISIELLNDVGEHPDKLVRVLVQGILLFPNASINTGGLGSDQSQQQSDNSALRDALVYPVVFSSNDFYIDKGFGSTLMMPRSDDILRKISEIKDKLGITNQVTGDNGSEADTTLKIKEGDVRKPYRIKVRITVIDEFYYGQTVVDVKDNEDLKTNNTTTDTTANTTDTTTNTPDTTSNPDKIVLFEGCRSVTGSQAVEESSNQNQEQNTGRDKENNQIIDQTLKQNKNPILDLSPPQTPQLDSPEVSYFSDIEWIPQIIIYVNNGEYPDMLKYIGRLRNEIPFGASPLYDAIIKNSSIILDEYFDKYTKVIYINTDNEENLSVSSIETAIQDVQSVDGFGKVPVVINNFSVVFPVTLSALVSRTDTDSLDKIANETGGQSQTILDAVFINDVLNNSLGRVEGSVGYGLYECVIDLGKNSIINNISLDYELYPNTDGNWKISTSEDGFNYSDYSDSFNPNVFVEFSNVNARYLKFRVTLLSGLSSFIESEYDLIPTPGVPSLTGININYSSPTDSFIYLNPEITDYSPQQIAVAVSANRPKLSEINVGATTGNSYNWNDYESGSQPHVDRYGKIFIPIRYNQENNIDLNEPLENIDGFMWKAKYGKWDTTSFVVIRDMDSNIVDAGEYKVYPKEGFIVFNSRRSGLFTISVENAGKMKLGVRIVNMDSENPIVIDGIGYMYNTNVFLPPPLAQRPPSVSDFRVFPSSPTVYQKVNLSYKYFDINQLEEDINQTEIRWYINGVEIEYLRNLKSWNNLQDLTDPIWIYAFSFASSQIPEGTSIEQYARQQKQSILKVNDVVYATIRVSDGILFSEQVRSPSVTVVESPPFITSISIKGKKNDGTVQSKVTTSTRAFADFAYFQDGEGATKSQIIWYVNGIEFKRGDLNAVVGGISNNEILVGEIKNNIVGITIGNTIEVTILPASQNIIGNPVTSPAISVENDPPSVRSVVLSPSPTALSSSALSVTYTYVDLESQQQGSTQNDQSSIRWLKAPRGSQEFAEVSSLQNLKVVSAINTSSGEKWKAEVIPFDGVSVGIAVQSNVVDIV